jgi:hypothetical protein
LLSPLRNCIRLETLLQIKGCKKLAHAPSSTWILYSDCQDLLVLSSTVASRYYYCCTDGSTSPGKYGYPLVLSNVMLHSWSSVVACTWLSCLHLDPGPASCVANAFSCIRLKHTSFHQFSLPPDLVSFDWKHFVHDEYTGSLQKNRETSIKSQWKNHRSFAVCLIIFRGCGGVLNWKDLHVFWINFDVVIMFWSRKIENMAVGDPPRWPHSTLYSQKLALTSPTSGGCLVGTVRSCTQATELVRIVLIM